MSENHDEENRSNVLKSAPVVIPGSVPPAAEEEGLEEESEEEEEGGVSAEREREMSEAYYDQPCPDCFSLLEPEQTCVSTSRSIAMKRDWATAACYLMAHHFKTEKEAEAFEAKLKVMLWFHRYQTRRAFLAERRSKCPELKQRVLEAYELHGRLADFVEKTRLSKHSELEAKKILRHLDRITCKANDDEEDNLAEIEQAEIKLKQFEGLELPKKSYPCELCGKKGGQLLFTGDSYSTTHWLCEKCDDRGDSSPRPSLKQMEYDNEHEAGDHHGFDPNHPKGIRQFGGTPR